MNGLSVIIIFSGRHQHLINTLKNLATGTQLPDEVIIVEMAKTKLSLPNSILEIEHLLISDFKPSALPIAKARNLGAINAAFKTLVFLDVDCMPSKNFIENIRLQNELERGIYMGKPLYLTKALESLKHDDISAHAIQHPSRPIISEILECDDYGLFWSLCFFIDSVLFFELGGFDENYNGYGAEDTDFAWKCKAQNVRLYLTPFEVYHQQHSFYRPPLNNISAIANNSNYFYSKWGIWPMINHLKLFEQCGYIKWNPERNEKIQLISMPNSEAISNAMVTDEPFS